MSLRDDRSGRARAGEPAGTEGRGPSTSPSPGFTCELCGAPMLDRHCKLVCLNCGYQRDCSDP